MKQYIKYIINKLKPSRVIQDIYGISYFDSRTDALTRHIAFHKVFDEYSEIDKFIAKYQTSFDLAIDVGANIGLVTLPLSKKFNKIVSFEPDILNFNTLKRNLDLNLFDNIVCNLLAVGDSSTTMELSINRVIDGDGMINTGLSSLCKKNRIYSKQITTVGVVTIDDYFSDNEINNLSFLKIDTEGYEYYTFLGAFETIKLFLPTIFYEFSLTLDNRMGVENRKKCFKLLHNLGYIHYYLKENDFKELEFSEIDNITDDINLFAVCN
jgi:FkbM family methyltransferase